MSGNPGTTSNRLPPGGTPGQVVVNTGLGQGAWQDPGAAALPANTTAINAIDPAVSNVIASDGAGWIGKTYAALKAALGLVKADVGLGNVDNTSDANKPISTAETTALAGKAQAMTRTVVKTTNYAAAAGDLVPVDTTAGPVTVTLPTAPATKSRIGIKHIIQGGTNAVTYATGGADVLNKAGGSTSGTLVLLAQSAILEYDAATSIWTIIADDVPVSQLDLRFQGLDSDLTTIAGLTAATDSFMVGVANAWAARTVAQVKATLALDNVTNTSDASKPVSTAQQTALNLKADLASPTFTGTVVLPAQTVTRAMEVNQAANSFRGNNTGSAATAVDLTVAQSKSLLALVKADVGLGSVDNTSDAGKPVSTAQQTALDLKANIDNPTFTTLATTPVLAVSGLTGAVNASRYVGAVASAAPSSGTFAVGDFVVAQTGAFFVCVIAGTPGTWTKVPDVSASPLFTTKGDLPVGTGSAASARLAAGNNGQVVMADSSTTSGLIYANARSGPETSLARTSAIAETMPRYLVDTVTVALATGVVFLQAIWLPKNKLITNIAWTSGTTPAGVPTNWWFTLCNGSRTTLRSTADQTSTAWAASTEKIVALSSTFTTLSEGQYYIGIMMKATTPITLQTHAAVSTLIGQAPILCGASSTAQTTPPADSTTLTAITAAGTPAYAYVS